jgi:hypothetical protein
MQDSRFKIEVRTINGKTMYAWVINLGSHKSSGDYVTTAEEAFKGGVRAADYLLGK